MRYRPKRRAGIFLRSTWWLSRTAWAHPRGSTITLATFAGYVWQDTAGAAAVLLGTCLIWLGAVAVLRVRILREAGHPWPTPWKLARLMATEAQRRVRTRHQWRRWCHEQGFINKAGEHPKIQRMRWTADGDLTGIIAPDLLAIDLTKLMAMSAFAARTMKAREFRVIPNRQRPGEARVDVLWSNPLRRQVGLGDLPLSSAPSKLAAFGIRVDGTAAMLRKDYSTLLGGMTGQGKSNHIHVTVASYLADGDYVRLYISDAKGGAELPAYSRYPLEWRGRLQVVVYDKTPEGAEAVLKKALEDLKFRQAHQPQRNIVGDEVPAEYRAGSKLNPWSLLIVDELMLIQAVVKQGVKGNLGQFIVQARASGFAALMATQVAHVEAIPSDLRSLISQAVCYATRTPEATDTVLGRGSVAAGALSHELDEKADQGICYVGVEGRRAIEPVRVPFVRDEDIDYMVEHGDAPLVMTERKLVSRPKRCALYRAWGYTYEDEKGRSKAVEGQRQWTGREKKVLLYVGIATNPNERMKQHRTSPKEAVSPEMWCRFVRKVDPPEWYESRHEALMAEAVAIQTEAPLWNIQHNGDNEVLGLMGDNVYLFGKRQWRKGRRGRRAMGQAFPEDIQVEPEMVVGTQEFQQPPWLRGRMPKEDLR